jgi:predicted NBD/HSP70 family sugar kinase
MAQAIGIDLGGTKVEAQVFDENWLVVDKRRIATPGDYSGVVGAVADQIAWAIQNAGDSVPIGISAAGLVSPVTGKALTANLPATGRPLPSDIAAAADRAVTYINDCRALTLSEAIFGVAKGLRSVAGLVIGTGVGGGFALNGRLAEGPARVGGEFGHLPGDAAIYARHDLPVLTCGCGRHGCVETYLAGPGMARLAAHVGLRTITPEEIAARRSDAGLEYRAWNIWMELLVSLVRTISLTCGPDAIVIAGGISKIDGLADDLATRASEDAWDGFPPPQFLIAEGGDASGARGAAYAAWTGGAYD